MNAVKIQRLSSKNGQTGLAVFAMMASVFDEPFATPSLNYVDRLLRREDFWVIAALAKDTPIGGLTGFVLPMIHSETAELLIHDIAVLPAHQRQGVGRRLVDVARRLAAERGVKTAWVPADNEDRHALDFYHSIGGQAAPVTIFTFRD
jgi:aminoglycoside 3-N-acetyltransferase I